MALWLLFLRLYACRFNVRVTVERSISNRDILEKMFLVEGILRIRVVG
mgnify:CR=1 FL=1